MKTNVHSQIMIRMIHVAFIHFLIPLASALAKQKLIVLQYLKHHYEIVIYNEHFAL